MVAEMVVTLPFRPRDWQRLLLDDPAPRIVAVVHRRAGKSTALMWRGLRRALLEPKPSPRVVHILPFGVQWKRTGLWDQAVQAADAIPGATVWRSELAIRLPNGGVWQAGGADNPDSWRGGGADEVVIDEFDDTPPSLVPLVIEPMLADRAGTLLRSGTPKGRGLLQAAYDRAKTTPGYSAYLLDYKQTGALSDEAIERLRIEMSEEEFAQELCCSFASPNSGSYYGKLMDEAEREGRVCKVPYDPRLKVWTSFDLGIDDSTAIWCCQVSPAGQWRLIDYIEGSGEGLHHYVRLLGERRYVFERHILPHDAEVRELGSGRSRRETLHSLGLVPTRVLANSNVADGINAVRLVLPKCWFDAERCAAGIKALRHYRREWNEAAQTWRSSPVHDQFSHCFVGETKILTRYGTYRIMDLPSEGEVLTPCGWKAYRNPRMTRRGAPLVAVTFGDGLTVKCTPDHMFLTANGWISARRLRPGLAIQSGLTRSLNTSTEGFIGSGRATAICLAAAGRFTAMSGGLPLVLFRLAATFITRTAIGPTTDLAISSACQSVCIYPTHGASISRTSRLASISPSALASVHPSGINQKRAVFGTAVWPSGRKVGPNGNGPNVHASSVASRCRLWFAKTVILSGSARMYARPQRIAHAIRLICGNAPRASRCLPDFGGQDWGRKSIAPSNARTMPTGAVTKPNQGYVRSAASALLRVFTRTRRPKSTAPGHAQMPVVASVQPLAERADVWCLTVPDAECFALENGAIVHNCADSMRYLALGVREVLTPKVETREPVRLAAAGGNSWMGL